MLSLTLVRSLVLGETINNHPLHSIQHHHHHHHPNPNHDDHLHESTSSDDESTTRTTTTTTTTTSTRRRTKGKTPTRKTKTPLLLFMPTKELVSDTYRLATIARDLGMDLHPTPSLSHIIFSYSSSSNSSSSSSITSPSSSSPSLHPPPPSSSSLWSSLSLSSSSSFSLPNNAVPLTFPSLSTSSLTLLRSFVTLSKGLFKLVFIKQNPNSDFETGDRRISNWDCCTLSLFSRIAGDRIETMNGFSRALAGKGWTLYKTKDNTSPDSGQSLVGKPVYLFRKMDANRVRARSENGDGGAMGGCRMRELRLPLLDFRNAPLRILQYILLMTDDVFYLA